MFGAHQQHLRSHLHGIGSRRSLLASCAFSAPVARTADSCADSSLGHLNLSLLPSEWPGRPSGSLVGSVLSLS